MFLLLKCLSLLASFAWFFLFIVPSRAHTLAADAGVALFARLVVASEVDLPAFAAALETARVSDDRGGLAVSCQDLRGCRVRGRCVDGADSRC